MAGASAASDGIAAAVVREREGERRVALTPDAVERLARGGIRALVERGAGLEAGFRDDAYAEAGATVTDRAAALVAQVVVRVAPPTPDEVDELRPGTLLVGMLDPLGRPELAARLAAREITALAMELVPRITRAQAMDALSSQATVAGYRGVLLAAVELPRFFPLLMTAAGTVPPAKVLVLGAGVAGLQAIATARRLGAVVSAFDVRAAAREQVESLGATFLAIELDEDAEASGGYAKELSEEAHRREQELVARHVAASDVVITTALVPGRRAPVLVTDAMVRAMRPGSVVVDLAAAAGGNCELTRPGERYVHGGVTILGPANPAGGMPHDASMLYARNIAALLMHVAADGELRLAPDDPVTGPMTVTRDGKVLVGAAKQPSPAPAARAGGAAVAER